MTLALTVKAHLKGLTRRLGFDVHRLKGESLRHETVRPFATYSPWNEDQAFLSVYKSIEKHTLVDKYRCFELWSLVEQAKKTQGNFIEIGVWRGGTGALIAKKASDLGISDPVYLCDTFEGVVKATRNDAAYKGGEHSDTSLETVESLVSSLGLTNVKILKGIFPDETGIGLDQEKFKFCHIDVDVYQSAKDIVEWIWEKMVVGGLIIFDDYGFPTCQGITKYVEEQGINDDRILIHNLNGHAVVVKIR